MEAIAITSSPSPSSSSNIVVSHSNGCRSLLSFSSTETKLERFQIGFLPAKKTVTGSFLKQSISFKAYKSVSAISASASLSQQESVQLELEASDSGTQKQEIEGTNGCLVRVKFRLQKECSFGEQFVLVGDDSVMGLWDPENGVPLDWSDGHVWAVELDIPTGKAIKYKFILKRIDGSLYWQPDPDRVLEPWETQNTIVVLEDWDDPLVQKIMEEEEEKRTTQSVVVKEEPVTDEEEPTNVVVDDSSLQVEEAGALALQEIETVSDVKEEQEPSESITKEEPAADDEDTVLVAASSLQVEEAGALAHQAIETVSDVREEQEPSESVTKEEPVTDDEDTVFVADSSLQITAENSVPRESQPVSVSDNEECFSVADVSVATQLEEPMASIMADDNKSITQNGIGQLSGESMNSDQKMEPVVSFRDDNVEHVSDGQLLVPEEEGMAVLVPGLLHTVLETPSEKEASEDERSVTAVDAKAGEVYDVENPSGDENSIMIEYDKEEANVEETVELLLEEEKVEEDDNVEAVVDGDERAPPVMNSITSTDSSDGILVHEEAGVGVIVPGLLSTAQETPSEEDETEGGRSVMVAFDASVEGANDVESTSGEEKAIAVEHDKQEARGRGEETVELLPKEEEEQEEKPGDGVEQKSPSSANEESRCSSPSGESDNVLQNDMQWVQKLLSNLGLL